MKAVFETVATFKGSPKGKIVLEVDPDDLAEALALRGKTVEVTAVVATPLLDTDAGRALVVPPAIAEWLSQQPIISDAIDGIALEAVDGDSDTTDTVRERDRFDAHTPGFPAMN